MQYIFIIPQSESESHSVVSDFLRSHGLYSPWNSPGQNTRVGSLSLLQGTFPTQGSNPGLPYCRQILYQLSHQGRPRILEWVAYPFSSDLPNPGIKLVCPALQADSLPTELPGKTYVHMQMLIGVVGTWRMTLVITLECFKNPSKEVEASCLPPSRAEKKGKTKKPFGLHFKRKRAHALRRPRQGLSLGIWE